MLLTSSSLRVLDLDGSLEKLFRGLLSFQDAHMLTEQPYADRTGTPTEKPHVPKKNQTIKTPSSSITAATTDA